MSNSVQPYALQPTKCLCPWDSPGKNTGVSCCTLLQGIFLTQRSNLRLLHLLHCRQVLYHWGFPDRSVGKESSCHVRDLGSIPGLGRSPGEGKGYPLQYSGLENYMNYGPCNELVYFHFSLLLGPHWKLGYLDSAKHINFTGCTSGKELTCQCRIQSQIHGLGRSLGERHGNPLQYSCLENFMDRGALWVTHPQGYKEADIAGGT